MHRQKSAALKKGKPPEEHCNYPPEDKAQDRFTCDRFYSCNDKRCFRFGCRVYLQKLSKEKSK